MSQTIHRDPEVGNNPDGHRDHPRSAPNQSESTFGDSSGKLFSIYSNVAEDEDNKMVERWQKDADGILIFTGLFSAAVAALLAVTVQDLRPNSQDTSAFYLGNIYGILADPNATRASLPSPSAKPPPFSPPRYSVWVNSLWFLSLVMSVSCALWATSLHQWARRYIRMTQPARCSPEKRARMRAFFAKGVDEMHIPWAVEGLPALLHLSLFLFFGGLVIFLFNIDQEVFICVVLWIGLFSVVYVLITISPLIRHDSPYYTPLSIPTWYPYAVIHYATFAFTKSRSIDSLQAFGHYHDTRIRYHEWITGGMEKTVEETASEPSSDVDIGILGWTVSALGDDDSLEKFTEAIPGFFNSMLVKDLREHLPRDISRRLWDALVGFVDRSLSSNSVVDKVKLHRLDIFMNAITFINVFRISSIFRNTLFEHWDQLPQPVELGHTLARWCTSNDQNTAQIAQGMVSKILWTVRERDDRWFELAARVYGLPERDLRDIVAHGDDSVSLAILIQMTRAAILRGPIFEVLTDFIKFDIRNTLSGLQHDFCTLWNEIVQEAKKQGYHGTNALILKDLRHLYIALHQGTDAAPTAFSASTYRFDPILFEPSTYPSCDIPSHRPDSIAHSADPPIPIPTQPGHSPDAPPGHSTSGCSTVNNAVAGPPSSSHPTTSIEFGDGSPALAAISPTLPVHTPSCPSDASPPGVVVATRQDIPLATTTSHPLEGTTQRDVVVLCTEPDVLSTTSTTSPTPTLASALASKQPVLNKSSESHDAGSASVFNLSLPASSVVGFSSPIPPPSSRDTPLPNAESLSLLGSTAASSPIENPTLPRLRARGLVNTGGMCFANAVLQLLVHSPSFRNLFRELGGLKGQRGVGSPATPLVDATVRFSEEFVFKEEPPPPQQAAGGKPREDKDATKEHKAVDLFEPMYMYDAMKEKRQLKDLLDGQQQDAEEFFRIYLNELDEESLALLASISRHKLAAAAPGVEEREISQSGHIDVGRPSLKVESVESPLMRTFGGKFRSTVRAPNQPDTVAIEDWQSLQLDIQHDSVHTIEDALARISHMQPVWLGPPGNEASQQVLIEALPPVLVLHLKRFLYDAATNGINKIGKPVQIAPELDILPDIMAPFAGKSVEPVHYKLYGVLYHHGKSAGSGHYTIDVLHQNGGSGNGEVWLHIDDEAVSAVRKEDVFVRGKNERVDNRCIYMLFYYRTAPTQT